LLLSVQLSGDFDLNGDVEVPLTPAGKGGHALFAKPENGAALRVPTGILIEDWPSSEGTLSSPPIAAMENGSGTVQKRSASSRSKTS
jgi:hypothetical protein